ncbi:hypothetical protein HPB47_004074 [Ixodes persulcatus]|uniref:Uncharacterized protein n=1 Tax=Ixodes persulcatus TaxID=34615 RepID=A0AC60PGQ7_IXOPE|nr:hypothetical protein HPB47_004074 [Ixodes persulcatus]
MLRRLAYPNRPFDLESVLGRHSSTVSIIANLVMSHVHEKFSHLLSDMNDHSWLSLAILEPFSLRLRLSYQFRIATILGSFGTPSYLGNAGTSTSTSYRQQPGPSLAPRYFQQAGTHGAPDHFQRACAFGTPINRQQAGVFGAPENLQHAGPFQAPQKFQQVDSASALQGSAQADSSSWSDGRKGGAPGPLGQVEEDDWTFEPECPEDACRPPTTSDDQGTALPDVRNAPPRQRRPYPDWSWIVVPVKRKHAMMEGTQPIRIPWDTSSLKK